MIGILVVLIIIIMMFTLDLKRVFNADIKTSKDPLSVKPWHNEDLIVPDGKSVKQPNPSQHQLRETLVLAAEVTIDCVKRGLLQRSFTPACRIKCLWTCLYAHSGRQYTYTATAAGNIVSDRIFKQNEAEDRSKLYMIAKGICTKKTFRDQKMTELTEKQATTIYITGFLCTDESAMGMITLTTDNKACVTYDWKTR
ncbi:MAG: hypothetical protein KAS23_08965 [Anaerohalosphaera sp.]|nr:hypothetical protein [Anaerohalosphaera sp.]